MKYLKDYKLFESVNEAEIHALCKKYGIQNYTINPDGSIDVVGYVNLYKRRLTKLPLKFNKVTGIFDCSDNQLTSLIGAPKEVGGSFYCTNNKLTSLEGVPERVGDSFNCQDNKLTSLEGAPKEVGGSFNCRNNQLTSLEFAPKEVVRGFHCQNNQLRSLEYAPERVGADFRCGINKIMNIDNLLWKSFESISLGFNPVYPIVSSWINNDNREELIEYFIDLGVIQGETVIMDRLKAFHEEMDLEMEIDFKEVEKYYTIIE